MTIILILVHGIVTNLIKSLYVYADDGPAHTYDPDTGTWNTDSTTDDQDSASNSTDTENSTSTPTDGNVDTTNSATPDSSSSGTPNTSAQVTKEQKKIEYRNLIGNMELRPSAKNMQIGLGATVRAFGFGKYLSGHFFVSKRKMSIDSSGAFKLEIECEKTKFGENMKAYVDADNADGTEVTINDKTSKSKKTRSKRKR